GIDIRPVKSDIDRGCGFLIRVDGLTIFHPGDAVDTSRTTPSPYTQTIDSLASIAKPIDLFFFPIRGCGFPDLEAVKKGVDYTISTLQPRVALPMHARNVEYELREYVREARQRGAKANYYCVRQPGDRFLFSKGKVKPL
ncbi:MBL fold metallo-hydrolase, partial [bacterium]|nr:MBL fold metallo-hydrolase [bacterium]